jgi:hypothetical protein
MFSAATTAWQSAHVLSRYLPGMSLLECSENVGLSSPNHGADPFFGHIKAPKVLRDGGPAQRMINNLQQVQLSDKISLLASHLLLFGPELFNLPLPDSSCHRDRPARGATDCVALAIP